MKMPVDWVFSVMLLLFCTETNHGEWLPIGIHSCLCDDQQKKSTLSSIFFRHFAFDAQEVAERVNGVLHK